MLSNEWLFSENATFLSSGGLISLSHCIAITESVKPIGLLMDRISGKINDSVGWSTVQTKQWKKRMRTCELNIKLWKFNANYIKQFFYKCLNEKVSVSVLAAHWCWIKPKMCITIQSQHRSESFEMCQSWDCKTATKMHSFRQCTITFIWIVFKLFHIKLFHIFQISLPHCCIYIKKAFTVRGHGQEEEEHMLFPVCNLTRCWKLPWSRLKIEDEEGTSSHWHEYFTVFVKPLVHTAISMRVSVRACM